MSPKRVIIHLRWVFQFGQSVIEGFLSNQGRPDLEVVTVSGDRSIERDEIKSLAPDLIVGDSHYRDTMQSSIDLGIPFIDVTGSGRDVRTHQVTPDEAAIGRLAAEVLRESGREHFAYIGFEDQEYSHKREEAFLEALPSGSFEIYRSPLSSGVLGKRERGLGSFVRQLPPLSAVFACSDLRATGVLAAAARCARAVPDDLMVLGVDVDRSLRVVTRMRLSSIDNSAWFVGWYACDVARRIIKDPALPVQRMRIPPVQVVKEGSAGGVERSDPHVEQLVQEIEARIHHPECLAKALASVPLSRRALELRVRKHLGCTPLDIVHRRRMEAILNLLAQPSIPLKEVALRMGFHYQGDLTRFVKDRVGITPSLLRQRSARVG